MLTAGRPVTGTTVPDGIELNAGPRSAQLIEPSCGKPFKVITPSTPATTGLSLDSVTTAPPAGAGPFRVPLPVEEFPPVTLAGFNDSAESTGGLIVRLAVCLPLQLSTILA